MKNIVMYLLLTFCMIGISAQSQKLNLNLEGDSLPVKKLDYSFQAGTMFYGGSMKGSTFYVAPNFTYAFSNKFTMEGGVMLVNNNYTFSTNTQNLNSEDSRLFSQPNKYQAIVYAKGNYKFNDKLSISSTIITNFNNQPQGAFNPYMNDSYKLMSMDLNYKITPNFSFGAGVRMVQGYTPYNSMYHFNSPIFPGVFEGI